MIYRHRMSLIYIHFIQEIIRKLLMVNERDCERSHMKQYDKLHGAVLRSYGSVSYTKRYRYVRRKTYGRLRSLNNVIRIRYSFWFLLLCMRLFTIIDELRRYTFVILRHILSSKYNCKRFYSDRVTSFTVVSGVHNRSTWLFMYEIKNLVITLE